MSSLFNKYAEKAQHAINQTPLGQYIPPQYQTGANASTTTGSTPTQQPHPTSSSSTPPPPHNATTGTPGGATSGGTVGGGVAGVLRQHGFSTLQNQLRSLQVQYSKGPDRQIQLVITAQKSISLQYEGAGRDAQTYSKELYLWGQDQPADIKDVTDRLAYLNFVHGALNTDLANKLDTARGPFKTARATEGTANTLRESGQGTEAVTAESVVEKRNALKMGEAARWKALREYGEKLILLSQASEVLIDECLPSSEGVEYTAKQRTAEVRSVLQQSLDNWHLSPAIAATSPFKSGSPPASMTLDPRGFGETHRQELDRTPSVVDRQKADQEALEHHATASGMGVTEAMRPAPATMQPVPGRASSGGSGQQSTGVNPAQLNNSPAPVPSTGAVGVPSPQNSSSSINAPSPTVPPTAPLNLASKSAGPGGVSSGSGVGLTTGSAAVGASVAALSTSPTSSSSLDHKPVVAVTPGSGGETGSVSTSSHPTMAETGVPISSTDGHGPGPSSGSLKNMHEQTGSSPSWSDPPSNVGIGGAKYESAEDEKKRLEREDRDRFLRFGTGQNKPLPSGPETSAAAAGPSSSMPTQGVVPANESAQDEKKRLEREERERILRGDGSGAGASGGQQPPQDGDQLPQYKEMM